MYMIDNHQTPNWRNELGSGNHVHASGFIHELEYLTVYFN